MPGAALSSEQAGTDNPTAHEKLTAIHRGSPQLRWASRLARGSIAPRRQLAQPWTLGSARGTGAADRGPSRDSSNSGPATQPTDVYSMRDSAHWADSAIVE